MSRTKFGIAITTGVLISYVAIGVLLSISITQSPGLFGDLDVELGLTMAWLGSAALILRGLFTDNSRLDLDVSLDGTVWVPGEARSDQSSHRNNN